jgi:diguanylate cyclase (GGDEF)-like protein
MQFDFERLASTDNLTGIYNRHKFEELFKIELARVARYKNKLALIMLDIDHFKKVNDTYGHDIGDLALKNVVNVINSNIRHTDIFARWGGEEFLILCPETDSENALILSEKLRRAIEVTVFKKVGKVTCSFGVASYEDDEAGDSFLKRVDNALYTAKDEGRNRVVVI